MQRARRVIGEVALSIAALLGSLCLVAAIAAVAFQVRPVIFRSGSMSPTIPAGSIGFARQVGAQDVKVGDVVSVPYGDSHVTHRVWSITQGDGVANLRLKGDANRLPDDRVYQVRTVHRLWFSLPYAGTVIAWLSRPPGVFVLALYLALMLGMVFRKDGRKGNGEGAGPGHRKTGRTDRPRERRLARLAVAGVGLLVPLGIVSPTWAAWGDSATVSGTSIGTYTVPPTTLSCGGLGVLSVTFNWTAVPNATNYTLHYGSGGSQTVTTTATTYTLVTAINGGTAYVTVNRAFGSTTWTSVNSNSRSYTVAVVSLCA